VSLDNYSFYFFGNGKKKEKEFIQYDVEQKRAVE